MRRSTRQGTMLGLCKACRWKPLVLGLAALPVFQVAGCFPDPIAAISFELQSLINTVLINAVNTVIQNILGL